MHDAMTRGAFACGLVIAVLCSAGCNERALDKNGNAKNAHGATDETCLSIVSWNDLHGTIEPARAMLDGSRVPAGGIVALADEVARVRDGGDDVVLLDAGDQWTGPLESTLAEGAPIVAAYDAMGVDAAALGNHDFDFGPVGYDKVVAPAPAGGPSMIESADGPRGALLARMAEAKYPYLSANLHFVGGATPQWNDFFASTVVTKGNWRVGVVGYTTKETPKTTLKPNVSDLDFVEGAAKSVASEIRRLRASGASPIVLLAHASMEGELPESLDDATSTTLDPASDPQGVKRVGEIPTLVAALGDDLPDLIVAGHRHAFLLGRVRGVPIVSSDQHGVGVARSRFCLDAGKPVLRSIEPKLLFATSAPLTPTGESVKSVVAPFVDAVKAQAEAHVATLPATCMHQALDGTAYAEQIARAIAERVGDAKAPPAGVPLVALVNAGGLRAPLTKGEVKFRDLFAAFPFENAVAVCETTLDGVTKIVANAIARPAARERFPFGITGAKVTVERNDDGTLDLREVDVIGDQGGPDGPVWLALPDFLLWGGDGLLDGVTCVSTATSSTRVRDAWRAVLARDNGGCDGPPKNVVVVPGD
jgi:5'-nucleotidase